MCGIYCEINKCCCSRNTSDNISQNYLEVQENILRRGPDASKIVDCTTNTHDIFFAASILWLQGDHLTSQPFEDDSSIFIYNGDIFGGSAINDDNRIKQGDTKLFQNILTNDIENNLCLSKSLSSLHGPYAFVYINKKSNKLYFGRDHYGRRSLLIGKCKTSSTSLILTSVAKRGLKNYDLIELPSIGTFCLDLTTEKLYIYPWAEQNLNFQQKLEEVSAFIKRDIITVNNYENQGSIQFNRGPNESDLLKFKIAHKETILRDLLRNNVWVERVNALTNLLKQAISKRISTQPPYCKNCMSSMSVCKHATTGVLFSGGIDCSILALLSDAFVDKDRPIDLINVAFDSKKLNGDYNTPDRQTGLDSLRELQHLCPERVWNFLQVNVTKEELDAEREGRIADLIYPLESILDDSLGCALWFAARGRTTDYTSSCRVLLVGMGADELFGGYTRHRAALKRDGWKGLYDTLCTDWQNLSHRNLARDDRVVSDHGRQLRTPYLDENLVNFVRSLDPWEKTYPSDELPQGIGEKILLRSVAYHIGLKGAAMFKKRALQFGSRIANSKENAHDISPRLLLNKH